MRPHSGPCVTMSAVLYSTKKSSSASDSAPMARPRAEPAPSSEKQPCATAYSDTDTTEMKSVKLCARHTQMQ